MADSKISDLAALLGADVDVADLLAIVDSSTASTKKITYAELILALQAGLNVSGTNTGDMSDAEVKTAYENNANTNAVTDAEKTVLGNTSGTNTGDMSNANVKTAYEANANTNAFTDSEQTNLGNQSGTNTGDQTSVSGTSGDTDALNSATTTVDVSAATAPTTGQVLTATSSTAATWQAAAGGGNGFEEPVTIAETIPVASAFAASEVQAFTTQGSDSLNFKLKYADGSIKRAFLPLYDAPNWATAKEYQLDNTNDYFESPTTGEQFGISGATAFSVNIIARFDMSATDTCVFFSFFAGTSTGKVEFTWLNSAFRFQVDGAYTAANPTRADKDYHICLVYDGSLGTDIARAKIYVDGADATASASGTIPSVVNTEIADEILGLFSRTGTPANYFNGDVKEVSIYNRALTGAEVTTLYNSGSYSDPTAISDCRSSWWFGDNTSDNLVEVIDNVGTNNLIGKNLDDGVIGST